MMNREMTNEDGRVRWLVRAVVVGTVVSWLNGFGLTLPANAADLPDPSPATEQSLPLNLLAINTVVMDGIDIPGWNPLASHGMTLTSRSDKATKFEREFGIHQPSSSGFLRWIQKLKYGLDTATFTAEQQVKRLEFTYKIGSPGPDLHDAQSEYALPLFGRFGQARLQSQLTTHDPDTGAPYFGLKLTIPFGNGVPARTLARLSPAERRAKSENRRSLRFAVEPAPTELPLHASAE